MPKILRVSFVQAEGGLTQHLSTEHAALSGAGADLFVVVDGRAQRLAFDAVHPGHGGCVEATAENEDLHVHTLLYPAEGRVDVVSTLTTLRPLSLAAFEHIYSIPETEAGAVLDDIWVPHRPGPKDGVIGRHAMRTPCLAVQRADALAALVPDLDALARAGPLPAVLDFDAPATLRIGAAAHRPSGRFFLRRAPREGAAFSEHDTVTLAFTILLQDDVLPHHGLGHALRFLWSRHAERRLDVLDPQILPFDDYARYAYDAAFERCRLWREVFVAEGPAGGLAWRVHRANLDSSATRAPRGRDRRVLLHAILTRALPARFALSLLERSGREGPIRIHFSARSNQLRSAYGMAHFARKWGDERLERSALSIIRLALCAPEDHGLFPSVCAGTPDRPIWIRGTRGDFLDRRYALADLCESGRWMMALAADLCMDAKLLDRAAALGRTLLGVQDAHGAVPAWIEVGKSGRPRAAGPLKTAAPTAAAGALFAQLARATGERRFLDGARAVASFIVEHVWPAHAWQDFETLSSPTGRGLRSRDRRTGLATQGTLSMGWAIDLLLTLRDAGDPGWLDPALAILDELLLYQQVWNPPSLGIDARGGFGATNTDLAWSDARQALFAPSLLRAYDATGMREYAIRAAAALRAAFALMLVPENAAIAPGNVIGMEEEDYGATPSRYGEGGVDARAPGPITFDWGSGSACAAAAWVERRYGDLLVDAARGLAFGLNGCRVREARLSPGAIELVLDRLAPAQPIHRNPLPRRLTGTFRLRARGLAAKRARVIIDGVDLGHMTREALEAGVVLTQHPHESPRWTRGGTAR